jgi:hypothetical protein
MAVLLEMVLPEMVLSLDESRTMPLKELSVAMLPEMVLSLEEMRRMPWLLPVTVLPEMVLPDDVILIPMKSFVNSNPLSLQPLALSVMTGMNLPLPFTIGKPVPVSTPVRLSRLSTTTFS